MSSIIDHWISNQDLFADKSVQQIINICGDGRLRDGSKTSSEFRFFLQNIPSANLAKYANECLDSSFVDSGMVLQDIVNQIGSRIGFNVDSGLYKGKSTDIGFDGIWVSKDGHALVVEVKTTDAYRINLDKLSDYRKQLIQSEKIKKEYSSILIVVGRQDTGDLEAQVRGSKHAWDVRLISTDSLIKLMLLKENLNDTKTIQQINQILKPQEFTRLDGLIEVIFLTTIDVKIDEIAESEIDNHKPEETGGHAVKFHPVNFHQDCIEHIQKYLKKPLVKESRSSYRTADNAIGIICSISKRHGTEAAPKYWFAYHPYYDDYLAVHTQKYIAYGCGDASKIVLIPYDRFKPLIHKFWKTEKDSRIYYHIVIYERGGKLLLRIPKDGDIDITEWLIYGRSDGARATLH